MVVSKQRPRSSWTPHKRKRCALALSEVVHERGAAGLTVARVVAQAKISRATFYDLFANCGGAFQYACGRETPRPDLAIPSSSRRSPA